MWNKLAWGILALVCAVAVIANGTATDMNTASTAPRQTEVTELEDSIFGGGGTESTGVPR